MKSKLAIILVFLLFLKGYGQINNGVVIYKLKVQDDSEEEVKDKRVKQVYDRILKASENTSFKLIFNKDSSSFTNQKKLFKTDNEERFNKIAQVTFGVSENFYLDLHKEQFIRESDLLGKNYNVINKAKNIDWKISSEKEMISDFTCYKATASIPYLTRNNEVAHTNVVAWFAPEIPLTFGPLEYHGLPGLILKVKIGKNMFVYASEISLNPQEGVTLEKPGEGTYITQEEYDALGSKIASGIFND